MPDSVRNFVSKGKRKAGQLARAPVWRPQSSMILLMRCAWDRNCLVQSNGVTCGTPRATRRGCKGQDFPRKPSEWAKNMHYTLLHSEQLKYYLAQKVIFPKSLLRCSGAFLAQLIRPCKRREPYAGLGRGIFWPLIKYASHQSRTSYYSTARHNLLDTN